MVAYTSKAALDVANPQLVTGVIAGNPPTKGYNWLIELSGEQFFWEPEGVSVPQAKGGRKEVFHVATKDFAQARPGFGTFYRCAYTPEDRSAYSLYLSGGFGGRGVIPGRPYDRLGIGPYWLKKSGDLNAQASSLLRNEVGLESFYNFAITPWLQLSGDAQWLSSAKPSSRNAWVLGTRLNARF